MIAHLSPEALEQWAKGLATLETERRHLDGCLECAQAVREMQAYFTALQSLTPKMAPSGFSMRVLKRVQVEAQKPWWNKLFFAMFFPMRLKVPLQLAGAGFAVLLVWWAIPRSPANTELTAVSEIEILDSLDEQSYEMESAEPLEAFKEKKASPSRSEEHDALKSAKIPTPEPPLPPIPDEMSLSKQAIAKQSAGAPAAYASRSRGMSDVAADKENVALIESHHLQETATKTEAKPLPKKTAEMVQEHVVADRILESLGFSEREGVYRLHTTKAHADSLTATLNKAGYKSRFTLKPIPPDSIEIEVK